MDRTTESESNHNDLEKKSISEVLEIINSEDKSVPLAVEKSLPEIEALIRRLSVKMLAGGRLFYLGAGTSGRLGIVDASECPPTFGVPYDLVVGLIAGGDQAIRKAVEFAEDDPEQGWKDLQEYSITKNDFVIGIAASGTTPYVLAALKTCNKQGIDTGCVVCNNGSPIAKEAKFPIEVVVGPEVITGSTRMKSGTAQKLVLNMITTGVMITLGKVKGNKMLDMQLSNNKLYDRGAKMIADELGLSMREATELLEIHGSVRKAIDSVGN